MLSFLRQCNQDFGGPLGALILIPLLPEIVYIINVGCNHATCAIQELPTFIPDGRYFIDVTAYIIVLSWIALQFILAKLPVGHIEYGPKQREGGRFGYRCNGIHAALVSLAMFYVLYIYNFPVTVLYDKHVALMCSSAVIAVLFSIYLYVRSRHTPTISRSIRGNTGYPVYDFFMGRELNPRFGVNDFDLKFFLELRPGWIGWLMINASFLAKSLENGHKPSPALVLVVVMQSFYILDALWFEAAMTTTLDIRHEGLGYMLVFGDLVWVPFTFSLTPRYLLEHSDDDVAITHWPILALIFTFDLIGYTIFRSSNHQKYLFKKATSPTNLERTNDQALLITSWWGRCRHPNYLGDIIMAFCWSLPTSIRHPMTYFYPVYLTILLISRERRDSAFCQQKYGDKWTAYCDHVKYRILPYVY